MKKGAGKARVVFIFNGGAIRGVCQAKIAAAVDGHMREFLGISHKGLGNCVDYVGGTSVGAINGLNLILKDENGNLKYQAKDLEKLFIENSGKIIVPHYPLLPFIPSFSKEGLLKTVGEKFGDCTFSPKNLAAKILISSFNLDRMEETVWSNMGSEKARRKEPGHVWDIDKVKIADAAISSASLPFGFKAHQPKYTIDGIEKVWSEVDGGFVCWSPINRLISDIVGLEGIPLSDLCVINVSTGFYKGDMKYLSNGKFSESIPHGISVLVNHLQETELSTKIAMKQVIESQGGQFFDISIPMLQEDIKSGVKDNPKQLKYFIDKTDKFLEDQSDYIARVAKAIIDAKGLNYVQSQPYYHEGLGDFMPETVEVY